MQKKSTLESRHSNFLLNIEIVGRCLDILKKDVMPDVLTLDRLNRINATYGQVRDNYNIGVAGILSQYYDTPVNQRHSIYQSYIQYMTGHDYIGKLNQCMLFIDGMFSTKHKKITNQYHRTLNIVTKINYTECECGSTMEVFSETSDLICNGCGKITPMYGTIFENSQFYKQDGQCIGHGCYAPLKHCKFWIDCIQAKENITIQKKYIDQVVNCMVRDGIKNRMLSCSQLRLYLKELRRTEFNDHIPFIRKIITGYVPPQLSISETRRLYNIFNKCVYTFDKAKPPGKSNTIYYPYIIYKILEIIIEKGIRKQKILECIHLQSRDTLISNDNIWERICIELPELTYIPTDRNAYTSR